MMLALGSIVNKIFEKKKLFVFGKKKTKFLLPEIQFC